jgi:hypothetical protein
VHAKTLRCARFDATDRTPRLYDVHALTLSSARQDSTVRML